MSTLRHPGVRDSVAIPRSRGMLNGLLIVLLGVWGGIIPFVGPYFNYAFINDSAFSFPTYGRLWLDILPAFLAIIAGLEMIRSANRPTASGAALLAAIAGAWFVLGPTVSMFWNHGASQAGAPLYGHVRQTVELLGYFYALGVIILFLGALSFGRVSVRSVRDVAVADRRRHERDLAAAQGAGGAAAAGGVHDVPTRPISSPGRSAPGP